MRLLADENFPLPTIEALRQAGHDVAWARTDAPGAKDTALLDAADQDGRILLTLDKDFWHVAVQRRRPLERGAVILFRVHPATRRTSRPWSSGRSAPRRNGRGTLPWSLWIVC